ncbi:MAG: branched-chain amino acid transporter permease [Christensenellales bacterium]|jgi:branched-subunit amino acid transport protein AzlD
MPDFWQSVAIVITVAAVTFLTRLAPFALWGRGGHTPPVVTYLGKALPPAVMAMLVVYSLKSVNIADYPSGLPEFLAIAVVAGLHVWKRNNLLSILSGTVVYMLLVQQVFV